MSELTDSANTIPQACLGSKALSGVKSKTGLSVSGQLETAIDWSFEV